VGHGVPDEVNDGCWDTARAFFDLPREAKLEIERPAGGLYGYFPMAVESLANSIDGMGPGDLKESINVGWPTPPPGPYADETEEALFAPNRWPSALPELRPVTEAYFGEMQRLSRRLLSIFALGLGLDATFFDDKTGRSPAALRVIDYPEQAAPPEDGQLRAGAHTDYGTLTILRQQMGRAGLQVHDGATDTWIDIPPVEGAYVINIGDLMARWTNDRWTSTLHRVIDPDAGSAVSARRQSMPFFFNADYSQVVECLPTCVGDGARYEPVLAGPHLAGKTRRAVA
jgi:isopenicillin N synthase-like dioxygenase